MNFASIPALNRLFKVSYENRTGLRGEILGRRSRGFCSGGDAHSPTVPQGLSRLVLPAESGCRLFLGTRATIGLPRPLSRTVERLPGSILGQHTPAAGVPAGHSAQLSEFLPCGGPPAKRRGLSFAACRRGTHGAPKT